MYARKNFLKHHTRKAIGNRTYLEEIIPEVAAHAFWKTEKVGLSLDRCFHRNILVLFDF